MRKKIIILIAALFIGFSLYTQQVTSAWIKSKRNIREYYKTNSRKLIDFDKSILKNLLENPIQKELENEIAILLREIISDNIAINTDNPILALEILETKITEKKLFFDVVTNVSFHYSTKNPFVIAKMFRGLKNLLEGTFFDNLKAFKVVFQNIKTPYIIKSQSEPIRYGAELIVIEIISYIREYIKIVKSGKVQINPEAESIIKDVYEDLSLEQGNFTHLPGAKELISEY